MNKNTDEQDGWFVLGTVLNLINMGYYKEAYQIGRAALNARLIKNNKDSTESVRESQS